MSARKGVEPGCNGGVWCGVEGHLEVRQYSQGRTHVRHIPLTMGQRKTIREAQARARKEQQP